MRRVKDLFRQVVAFGNLYRAFLAASAGKRDQPEVATFEYHLESQLLRIRRDLAGGIYSWGAYRRFLIHDPKRREIRAAPFRDRVVHHALAESTLRASVGSWFGLADHADAFRLSRSIFSQRDAGNIGKRLLVRRIVRQRGR